MDGSFVSSSPDCTEMSGCAPSTPRQRLWLRNATVACQHSGWRPRTGVDLLLEDGRVLDPALAGAADGPATVTRDASHLLLIPGFLNGHTHSPEVLARGRVPNAPLEEWLADSYRGLDVLQAERLERAIAIAAQEMRASGAVAVTDHLRQRPHTVQAITTAVQAWLRSGLDARVAINLRDQQLAAHEFQSVETLVALAGRCIATLGAARVGLGPSAPQRCSDALVRAMTGLARESGAFLHMHVYETRDNVRDCEALYGRSAVAHLDALGFLGPQTELVHGVHLADEDLRRMAAQQTTLVHCPLANMRLGSGIAPVARALRLGVPVRLATDGAGSNDAQNMLEVVKMTSLLSRLLPERADWLTPEQALALASGSAALTPGSGARAIGFDLRAPCFAETSTDELIARLVFAAPDSAICWHAGQDAPAA
jgi:5-methylthioadenosine/S-adenosylhomocysteine deaminase